MCSVERVKCARVSPANSLPKLAIVSQFSSPYCYSGLASKRFIFTSYFLHSVLALVVEYPEARKEDRKLVKGAKRETPPVLNRRRFPPSKTNLEGAHSLIALTQSIKIASKPTSAPPTDS